MRTPTAVFCVVVLFWAGHAVNASRSATAQDFRSHPPMRPLPTASSRPMATTGQARFVDPGRGDDRNPGSAESPWQTIGHAATQLTAGDVLYLRGGIYFEHLTVQAVGTPDRPITIRSFPGELAVLDGGLREFFEQPASAWTPVADGAADEYRSARPYPQLVAREDATNLLGNFGDSMVPLHGYRFITDLRSSNEYFYRLNAGKTDSGDGVYCGPGVFYDAKTGYIHIRLAHTRQPALGDDNYRSETDPRKLPLVIAAAGQGSPLAIDRSRYVRFQDLVVRGARDAAIVVANSFNVEFDGVTAYGGSSAMEVRDCGGLRLWNCALRGIAAPWTFRGSLKYRAIEARIFSASRWAPTGADNHDFELAFSEFTDCVDGVFIGNVRNVRFHHNLLDNVSDDGIFLTATTAFDGTTPGGNVHIYQNLLSRCLTTFAFGVGHGRQKKTPAGRQAGAGVWIYRNVFDFRRPVMYTQPKEDESQITSFGRVAGDHGGPLWEPMWIYHNTMVHPEAPWRGYYLSGLGSHLAPGSKRRLFNNLVVQAAGQPGSVLPALRASDSGDDPLPIDLQTDGNLHWSEAERPTAATMFARFRNSPVYDLSKKLYGPGWAANDLVADPRLVKFAGDWQTSIDCRLGDASPAINAGQPLPNQWPDPLREHDLGKPDIGAMPAGTDAWPVGSHGRLSVFGNRRSATPTTTATPTLPARNRPTDFLLAAADLPESRGGPNSPSVAIVQGYPAFDAPLIEFALRRAGVAFETLERAWLEPAEYQKYDAVIVVGNLARAGVEPNKYSADDLQHVRAFLDRGGTLMLCRGNTSLFATDAGRAMLAELTGSDQAARTKFELLLPRHPWINHLDAAEPPAWVNVQHLEPIRATRGQRIIGDRGSLASLYRLPVGDGQLIYVGWNIAAALPHGRLPSTVEQEADFEQQMKVLTKIVQSIATTIQSQEKQ